MSLLNQLEPHARRYMERLIREGGKPLPQLSLEAARQYMRDSQQTPLEHPSVSIETTVAAGMPVTLIRPRTAETPLPAVLYLHGGGWTLGSAATHARFTRELALRAHAVLVVPEYPLAPETRFPVALEQCYALAQWIRSHGSTHGIDAENLAVAGDSAGGNLAAALALLAVQRGHTLFCLQALLCPVLDASSNTGSYREFAEGLNLTKDAMEWFWDQYVEEPAQRSNPLVSPLRASATDLTRVAPALIVTAECDVLRDEAEHYARRLMESGVPTTAFRSLGTLHNFAVIDDLKDSGPSIAATHTIGEALRSALHSSL